MKLNGKKFIIDLTGENEGVISSHSVEVSVFNYGAGPTLVIAGNNLAPEDEFHANAFMLTSEREIDELAQILKRILSSAETGELDKLTGENSSE